jgi:hypothetical protein
MFRATKRTLIAAAVIASVAPSAAYARPAQTSTSTASPALALQEIPYGAPNAKRGSPHASRGGSEPVATHAGDPAAKGVQSTARMNAARTTAASSQGGFQWGDAGIGAAGTFLLLSAGAAAAMLTLRRHHRTTIT